MRWFYLCPEWLFQYHNEVALGEYIENYYLIWRSEQHRLTPKYDIIRSVVPHLKHYHMTMNNDYNQIKITCQQCNGF